MKYPILFLISFIVIICSCILPTKLIIKYNFKFITIQIFQFIIFFILLLLLFLI